MDRRRALGLIATALAAPAGCLSDSPAATGPRNPPDAPANEPRDRGDRDPVRIGEFDFEAADDGSLRVFGTVENDAAAQRRVSVRVRVTTDETRTRTVTVDVPPESTAEFAAEFDVAYEAFASSGSLDVEIV